MNCKLSPILTWNGIPVHSVVVHEQNFIELDNDEAEHANACKMQTETTSSYMYNRTHPPK